jgi:citrate synthase
MPPDVKAKAGLEDIVATSSRICYLDGDRGVLAYCGYDIHDLARHATFEETCYLLWHGRLPTRAELGRPAVAAGGRPRAARVDPAADEDAAAV